MRNNLIDQINDMMRKRSLYRSIEKDIFKGFKRLFWFFVNIKYKLLTIKFIATRQKINKFHISLLLPTRERSKKFERMLQSLYETCEDINRIELLVLLDNNDKEEKRYEINY